VEEGVEFVFVAEGGPNLFADGGDGSRVDFARFVGEIAAERGGAGAALFETGFVEIGVGVGVEEFVGEDGRGWGVDGEAADSAFLYAAEKFDKAIEVHCFLKDILHDFIDEGVVGDLDVADDGLEAGRGLGEDGGHEVFGTGALDLRGDAFALRHAQELLDGALHSLEIRFDPPGPLVGGKRLAAMALDAAPGKPNSNLNWQTRSG